MFRFNKISYLSLVIIFCFTCLSNVHARVANETQSPFKYVPDQLMVELNLDKNIEDLAALNNKYGVTTPEELLSGISTPQKRILNNQNELNRVVSPQEQVRLNNAIQEDQNILLKIAQRNKSNEPSLLTNKIYLLTIRQGTLLQALKEYSSLSSVVKSVSYNFLRTVQFTPNDPQYIRQINMESMERVWDITKGRPKVVISVVDTGVRYSHEDLINPWRASNAHQFSFSNVNPISWATWRNLGVIPWMGEVYTPSNFPRDFYGHGTDVAGAALAQINNKGMTGVCPNCKGMYVKVGFGVEYQGQKVGLIPDFSAMQGIIAASENGADIITAAWGGYQLNDIFEKAVSHANSLGVVIVAAAGNDATSKEFYPAAYSNRYGNVIAVGASEGENPASYTNYGSWVDVSAPGSLLTTTNFADNSYEVRNGTSMAAAYVAGLTGLAIAVNPNLTPYQLKAALKAGVNNVIVANNGNGNGNGNNNAANGNGSPGLINPAQVLNIVQSLTVEVDRSTKHLIDVYEPWNLMFDIVAPPGPVTVTATVNGGSLSTIDASLFYNDQEFLGRRIGTIAFQPLERHAGQFFTFVLNVTDSTHQTISTTFVLGVRLINRPPRFTTPGGVRYVDERETFREEVRAEDPERESVTITASIIDGSPDGADLSTIPGLSFDGRYIQWIVPRGAAAGSIHPLIKFRATDIVGKFSEQTMQLIPRYPTGQGPAQAPGGAGPAPAPGGAGPTPAPGGAGPAPEKPGDWQKLIPEKNNNY